MIDIRSELFTWRDITIHQDQHVMKAGTDALLLGNWIPTLSIQPAYILDAGTGNGILSLLLARQYPHAQITAVDIDVDAVKCAAFNFSNSLWHDRLKAIQVNIEDLQMEKAFDLVVTNPPFYQQGMLSPSEKNNVRKHATFSLKKWIASFRFNMKAEGYLAMIIPYRDAGSWIAACNENGLFVCTRMNVQSYAFEEPVRSLLLMSHQIIRPSIYDMVIYEKAGQHTKAFLELAGNPETDEKEKR